MSSEKETFLTRHLDQLPRYQGFIIDLFNDAQSAVKSEFVPYKDLLLNGKGIEAEKRGVIAETHVVGYYDTSQEIGDRNLGPSAFPIKKPGDLHVALPEYYEFALPQVDMTVRDALSVLGPEVFRDADLRLIVKRSDVEGQSAQRPIFAQPHRHGSSDGRVTDMLYTFGHDTGARLGTEMHLDRHRGRFIEQVTLGAPNGAVVRSGGEILHNSKVNDGDVVRREWGAVMCYLNKPIDMRWYNGQGSNAAMMPRDHENFEDNKLRAADVLAAGENVRVLDTPQSLIEHAGVEVEYLDHAPA